MKFKDCECYEVPVAVLRRCASLVVRSYNAMSVQARRDNYVDVVIDLLSMECPSSIGLLKYPDLCRPIIVVDDKVY